MALRGSDIGGKSSHTLFGHTATAIGGGKIVLFGGAVLDTSTGLLVLSAAAHVFSVREEAWAPLRDVGAAPSPRLAHAAACTSNGRILLHGGSLPDSGSKPGRLYSELYCLDVDGRDARWSAVSPAGRGPGARYGHTLAFSQPHLVLFGGKGPRGELADLWVLDLESLPLSWSEVRPERGAHWPSPRAYHAAVVTDEGRHQGEMFVFGGRSAAGKALGDAWSLSRLGSRWEWQEVQAVKGEAPEARCMHSCAASGTRLLVIGGCRAGAAAGEPLPSAIFDVEARAWHSIPACPRLRHASCVEGPAVCLVGGVHSGRPRAPLSFVERFSVFAPEEGGALEEGAENEEWRTSGFSNSQKLPGASVRRVTSEPSRRIEDPLAPATSLAVAACKPAPALRVMDLFAGVGGFGAAAKALGMTTVAVSGVDPDCLDVLAANFPEAKIFGDLSDLGVDALEGILPEVDILTAGIPCRPYSGAGARRGVLGPRAQAFNVIPRVLLAKRPLAFLLENVAQLENNCLPGGRKGDAIRAMLAELQKAGYTVARQVIDSSASLPQHRKRVYIVGFRSDIGIALEDGAIVDVPDLRRTVQEVLDLAAPSHYDLPEKDVQHLGKEETLPWKQFRRWIRPQDQAPCCITAWRDYLRLISSFVMESGRRLQHWTPEEFHRLQGFPSSFQRRDREEAAYKQAGNAVSPPIVALLLGTVAELLRNPKNHALARVSANGRWAAWQLIGASLAPGR